METGYLSLLVRNHFGVLTKVSGLFGRRGFNISALSVGETENPEISRITIYTKGDDSKFQQIYHQVCKIEEVLAATILPPEKAAVSELALIKLKKAPKEPIGELTKLEDGGYLLRIVGLPEEINSAVKAAKACGIIEMSRTGPTVLEKSANVLTIKEE